MDPRSTVRAGLRVVGLASVTGAEFGALQVAERLRGVSEARRDAYVRAWCRRLLTVFGVRVLDDPAVASLAPVGARGRLLVANHRSMLDILVLLSRFGGSMLAKDELQRSAVFARLAAVAGTLYVDRASSASGAASIRRVGERLARGGLVTVFAEGTTYPGDEVRDFHAGAFLAAGRVGAEVLPVGLAYREPEAIYWQEPLARHGRRVLSLPSITVGLRVGAMQSAEGTTMKRLSAATHAAVQDAVHRARGAVEGAR